MKKEYNITIFSENHIGLLNRITIVFTRRKINIDSLIVSESAIKGVYKFLIVVNTSQDSVKKVVAQIEKLIDVIRAFYHTNEEMVHTEIALYKVSTEVLFEHSSVEQIVRKAGGRILEITRDYIMIEKTGYKEETQALFEDLNQFKVLQFARSGKVALTRDPIEKLSVFLKERDAFLNALD
ncbi:MAG: acetolactate synthase small subunit [Prolixibacteraceae bacterium]|nr:acetolactate synthase small subunit [Prolixibacteraceae bacterium]